MSLVTIIIPVYNSEGHLADALNSAMGQSYQNIEIIVINDGSTDNSLDIAKEYEKLGVKVLTQVNKGASAARNLGLRLAKGEFIQFLDADDRLHTDKIMMQINSIKSNGEIAICKTVHFFDGDQQNQISDSDDFFENYLDEPFKFLIKLYGGFDYKGGMIQPNAFLVPMDIIRKAGYWNEELSLDDDGEFFCRVVLNAKTIRYQSEGLNFYRKYRVPKSLSGLKSETAYTSQYKSIQLRHKHLQDFCNEEALAPFINIAIYRVLEELLHHVYPTYKDLYKNIEAYMKSLGVSKEKKSIVFGGPTANFIGNKVSWKLLKQVQRMKTYLKPSSK